MRRLLCVLLLCAFGSPSHAQFYKNKTLTLLVNYGAGGNADTEVRVFQHYLPKYIAGHPSVIIENEPGAGGFKAMNTLGLGIGSRNDGLTAGYFTIGAVGPIVDDPALKVKIYDFIVIAGLGGWNVTYGRKDIAPGLHTPFDLSKLQHLYVGGYAKASSFDTRLRMALDIFKVPYTMVTGFPATADINKAMVQNELNFSGSSMPGYETQVVPQIIETGIGIAVFQYPIIGKDGQTTGNPALEAKGIPTFDEIYEKDFGKKPAGVEYQALLLLSDIGTQLQRGIVLPKGSPPEAAQALRDGVAKTAADPEFIAEYRKVTGDLPNLVTSDELQPVFERMRTIDPAIKDAMKASIGD
jgi:hypothetical protein